MTFEPECLTIALGSGCNLDCTYCYAKASQGMPAPTVDKAEFLATVDAAAELVARTCTRHGRRLAFGFQGTGEPFLDRGLLEEVDAMVRAVAVRHQLRSFSFITSNGTLDEASYRWAAERFDRICLSIDGPPRVHDGARRFLNGDPTSARVARTVRLLKALGKIPACRVTVTSQNVGAMAEMAAFLYGEMGVLEVQFEPVHLHTHMQPEPELFVRGLLDAMEIAAQHGGRAAYSGCRPDEVHGPYCQTQRGVLFLTRRGLASACLFRDSEGHDSAFTVGGSQGPSPGFRMDASRIDAVEAALAPQLEACRSCDVREHCTRGCPDVCPLMHEGWRQRVTSSLGCRINRLLASRSQTEALPEVLLRAQREARQGRVEDTVEEYLANWDGFLSRLRARIPSAQVADQGATVSIGNLSPGCVHCKQGSWDCLFVTKRCNLACSFCCSPRGAGGKRVISALGSSIEQAIENYRTLGLRGISLTGGEPFMEPEQTFSLLGALRRSLGEAYLWLYTNGLLLRPEHVQRLAELGLDEIRFNTAGTGYADPILLRNMALAARGIATVTVEIPAIPGDAERIIECLSDWCLAGVKHLNLHELIRESNSNSARLQGQFQSVVLPDGHVTEVALESRDTALDIMQAVAEEDMPLTVNLCSLVNKLVQLRGRRRNVATLRQKPFERLSLEGFLDTGLAYSTGDDYEFLHPDDIDDAHASGRRRLFLIRRLAPLSLEDPDRVVEVREVRL